MENEIDCGGELLEKDSIQFGCSVVSDSLRPHRLQHQAFLSITNSWSLLKLTSIELVMLSNHLILSRPLSSCLQSFPASGSFPVSQIFTSGGQSIGVSTSASVLPMNIGPVRRTKTLLKVDA